MIRKTVLALFVLALVTFVYLFYTDSREISHYPITSWATETKADCAVVLTGGAGRIREGIDLLSRGQVKKLIISGVHPKATQREIFPMEPYYPSLREQDVILERRSTTTYGNAVQSASILEALRCKSVALVTSRTHMYRARKTFQSVLPSSISIVEHGVISGEYEVEGVDLVWETLKSVFYSLWAY